MLIRRCSARKRHEARLAWLRPKVAEYHAVPGIREDVTASRSIGSCEAMHACGLMGKTTADVRRETVRRLLSELRGENVGVGW
jgi:riboflavin synthase